MRPQSCPTLWDPMDCSPPGSSVHGDSPVKITGVGCLFLLQGIFPTQGLNPHLLRLSLQADSLPPSQLGSAAQTGQIRTHRGEHALSFTTGEMLCNRVRIPAGTMPSGMKTLGWARGPSCARACLEGASCSAAALELRTVRPGP